MDIAQMLDGVRLAVAGVFVAAGLLFMLGGTIGLLRFPDFYTRLHAVNVSDTLGGVILIVGLAIAAWDLAIVLRLALLAALIVALGPTVTQLAANAAHAAGLSPIAGKYTAPRPGPQRKEPSA